MHKPYVILIQSCSQLRETEKDIDDYEYPPMGLVYIANFLEFNGYNVKIIDLYHMQLNTGELENMLQNEFEPPILVGISSYTDSIYEAYRIAGTVKRIYSNVPVLLGGPHVSFMYQEVMKECLDADYCCIGEGEAVFIELLEWIIHGYPSLNNIESLVYRDQIGAVQINNRRNYINCLDILPLPLYSYEAKQEGLVFVSSRGCPGECIFCVARALSGSIYRIHSAEWIISLIYFSIINNSIKYFAPLDDTFTVNKSRLYKLTDYLEQLNIKIPWSCKSRVDAIDDDFVKCLSAANCKAVHIGVESGDNEILKQIGKNISLKKVFHVIEKLSENEIRTDCSFILGHPYDNLVSIERTVILASLLDLSGFAISVIGFCTPFPGTNIWNNINKYNLNVRTYNWDEYNLSEPVFSTSQFSTEDLKKAYFYYSYLSRRGKKLPELTQFDHTEYIDDVINFLSRLNKNRKNRRSRLGL